MTAGTGRDRPRHRRFRASPADIVIAVALLSSVVLALVGAIDGSRQWRDGQARQEQALRSALATVAELDRWIVNAGAGLVQSGEPFASDDAVAASPGEALRFTAPPPQRAAGRPLGCALPPGEQPWAVAPVRLRPGTVDGTDELILMSGASATLAVPMAIAAGADGQAVPPGSRTLRVPAVRGIDAGDAVLVYGDASAASSRDAPRRHGTRAEARAEARADADDADGVRHRPCAVRRVARTSVGTLDDAGRWTPAGVVTLTAPLPFPLTTASLVHLGAAPAFVRLRVDAQRRLVSEDLLQPPGAPLRLIATDVAQWRAQLGIDADGDGAVDRWLGSDAVNDGDAREAMIDGRVTAVRIGVLTRIEEAALGGPTSAGRRTARCATPAPADVLAPSPAQDDHRLPEMPAIPAWPAPADRCFRYGQASTIVPLRNPLAVLR